jgi:hypothetical protein
MKVTLRYLLTVACPVEAAGNGALGHADAVV